MRNSNCANTSKRPTHRRNKAWSAGLRGLSNPRPQAALPKPAPHEPAHVPIFWCVARQTSTQHWLPENRRWPVACLYGSAASEQTGGSSHERTNVLYRNKPGGAERSSGLKKLLGPTPTRRNPCCGLLHG